MSRRPSQSERRTGLVNNLGVAGALKRNEDDTVSSTDVYAQLEWQFAPRWNLLAGVRYDRRESEEQELRINPRVREKTSDAVLPLVGLVFQPTPAFSLYGSFATSFTPPPPGATDARGENPFGPERGRQFEAGVKAEIGQGRGEATLSFFEITKDDVLITLVAQAVNDQIGQERSRGLEATLSHRILDNWQVIAGYAFADSKVTEDSDPVRVGSRIANGPRHSANLWSRYDVRGGSLAGLGFGVGLVYTGQRAGTIRASTSTLPVLSLPSYFRLDTGLYYVARRYELTLRVVNLLDELYYESNLGTGTTSLNIRPGSPRARLPGSESIRRHSRARRTGHALEELRSLNEQPVIGGEGLDDDRRNLASVLREDPIERVFVDGAEVPALTAARPA